MSVSTSLRPRLVSLDQFRGYTVAGMFLVNFLAEYKGWVPPVLHHHHTYCSYADTIMPQFLFAVGFAMRLSFGRRIHADGAFAGYHRMVRRILGLFLVAFAVYTEGRVAANWGRLEEMGAWNILFPFLKREWMQTLGQIAATSLWILPVIRAGAGVRIAYMVFSGLAHVALSHWFNYHWVNSDPAGIDGGPLGFLTWAVPAITGTLVCDAVLDAPGRAPLFRLTLAAVGLMALGYIFSCGTRLYDLSPSQVIAMKEARKAQGEERRALEAKVESLNNQIAEREKAIAALDAKIASLRKDLLRAKLEEVSARKEADNLSRQRRIDLAEKESRSAHAAPESELVAQREALAQAAELAELKRQAAATRDQIRSLRDVKLAPSPVIPPREAWEGRTWTTLLAEPPFVPPPADDPRVDDPPYELHRYWNYWMMTQRGGALSYLTFCAGFSILVYLVFYVLGDLWGIRIGVFRTLGTNALAAYVLASMIGNAVKTFIPGDAPAWYALAGFSLDFFLIWLFVRTLEKNGIFLRV
jgi:predicted acyltransferase